MIDKTKGGENSDLTSRLFVVVCHKPYLTETKGCQTDWYSDVNVRNRTGNKKLYFE